MPLPHWFPPLLELLVVVDGPLLACALGVQIYLGWLRSDCSAELLRRERARNLRQQDETMRIACESFARAGRPTLSDLVSSTGDDWSLKP
jgi:hypothetical protein